MVDDPSGGLPTASWTRPAGGGCTCFDRSSPRRRIKNFMATNTSLPYQCLHTSETSAN